MEKPKRETLTVPGGKISLYTLDPKDSHKNSLLIIPGWCESAKVTLPLAKELTKFNYKVFVIDYSQLDNPSASSGCNVDASFPITERARACAVIEFLKVKSSESKIHLLAHSQGAVAAMLVSVAQQNRIAKVILVAPAGIVTSKLAYMILHYLESFFAQLSYVLTMDMYLGKQYFEEVWRYAWRNPIQLTRDAYGISKSNIAPLIKIAREQKMSIDVIITKNDRLFPSHKMQENTKPLCPVHELSGNHDELFFKPEKFAKKINSLFEG